MKRAVLAEAAAEIVIAYLSNGRTVPAADMKLLVGRICGALNAVVAPVAPVAPPLVPRPKRWKPAVAPPESVRADAIICLMCGKECVTLRRHIGRAHRLSPEQYREMFKLPKDYPMDAPNYTKVRSDLARARGLGKYIVWEDRPRADPDRRRRKRREGR